MIIAGWGKKAKKLADAGLYKCENCNNITTFELKELANYASAYFIKIAKWKKKYYLICSICDAGYELTEDAKNEILKISIEIPSNFEIINIWKDVDALCSNYLNKGNDIEEWPKYAIHEMQNKEYSKSSIEYVLTYFNQYLIDLLKKQG